MFKWRQSHKAQDTTTKLDSKELETSSPIEHVELREEPEYPSVQGIELKDLGDSVGLAGLQGGFARESMQSSDMELDSSARTLALQNSDQHAPTPSRAEEGEHELASTQGVDEGACSGTHDRACDTPAIDDRACDQAFDETQDRQICAAALLKSAFNDSQEAPSEQSEDSGWHEKCILLFDLDGTLLDSLEGIYHSFTHACGVAFSPTLDEVRALIGLPLAEMFVAIGFSPQEAQDRAIAYKNHYRKIYLQETKLLPNVIESLIIAKSFAHLGVVTTKTAQYSRHILQHFDILRFFQVVIGSEDVQHPKPSAEPILKALDHLPITPKEQVFMIGDTIYDLEAASNAHINGVWVRSGYGVGLESSAMMSFEGVYEAVSAIRAQATQYTDNWHRLE